VPNLAVLPLLLIAFGAVRRVDRQLRARPAPAEALNTVTRSAR